MKYLIILLAAFCLVTTAFSQNTEVLDRVSGFLDVFDVAYRSIIGAYIPSSLTGFEYDSTDDVILTGGNNLFAGTGGNIIKISSSNFADTDVGYDEEASISTITYKTKRSIPFIGVFYINETAGFTDEYVFKVSGQIDNKITIPVDFEVPSPDIYTCNLFFSIGTVVPVDGTPIFSSTFLTFTNNPNISFDLTQSVDPFSLSPGALDYSVNYTVTPNGEAFEAYVVYTFGASTIGHTTAVEDRVSLINSLIANSDFPNLIKLSCDVLNGDPIPEIPDCENGNVSLNLTTAELTCMCDDNWAGQACDKRTDFSIIC